MQVNEVACSNFSMEHERENCGEGDIAQCNPIVLAQKMNKRRKLVERRSGRRRQIKLVAEQIQDDESLVTSLEEEMLRLKNELEEGRKNRLLQQKTPNHEIYRKEDEQGCNEAGMGTSTSQNELREKDILDVISMETLRMKLLRKKSMLQRVLERIKKKKQRLKKLVDRNHLDGCQINILNEELNRSVMRSATLVEVNLSSMRAATHDTTLPVVEERHGRSEQLGMDNGVVLHGRSQEQGMENGVVFQANVNEQNMEKSNGGDCDSDVLTVSTATQTLPDETREETSPPQVSTATQTPPDDTVEETSPQELGPISVKENNFMASETDDNHAGDHDLYTLQCMALRRKMEVYEAQKELCNLEMAKTRNEIEYSKRKHALEVEVLEAKKRMLDEETKFTPRRPVQQAFGPLSWS